MMKLIADGPYAKKLDDQQKLQAIASVRGKNDAELLEAAEVLYKIITQIVARDPAYTGTRNYFRGESNFFAGGNRPDQGNAAARYDTKKLKTAASEWACILATEIFLIDSLSDIDATRLPFAISSLREYALSTIHDISALVAQKFLEKEYLYASIKTSLSAQLHQNTLHQLEALAQLLLSRNSSLELAKKWLGFLERLTEELRRADTLNAITSVQTVMNQSLFRKFEAKFTTIAKNADFLQADLESIFPESVQVNQIGSCIYLLLFGWFASDLLRYSVFAHSFWKSSYEDLRTAN